MWRHERGRNINKIGDGTAADSHQKKDSDEDEPTVLYLPTITVNPTSLLDKKHLVPMVHVFLRGFISSSRRHGHFGSSAPYALREPVLRMANAASASIVDKAWHSLRPHERYKSIYAVCRNTYFECYVLRKQHVKVLMLNYMTGRHKCDSVWL
jgi:hypothetical protein